MEQVIERPAAEYVARISYGKDSLKMLDVICSRGLPLDRITTTDVWATDTIPAWLPPMQEFRERMDEWIRSRYGIQVEHLCAMNKDGTKKTYEQLFYHVPNRRSQFIQVEREREPQYSASRICGTHGAKPVSNGAPYRQQSSIKGFPGTIGVNWCQKLKLVPDPNPRIPRTNLQLVQETQDRLCTHPFSQSPPRRAKRNIVEYLGIAANEPARFAQLSDRKRAPLAEFGIEEGLCGLYCTYNGILAPSYETGYRDGCWFCHNQGVNQLRQLRKNWPDYWSLLLKWDADSPISFKADGHTVHDFDRRFQLEDDGYIYPGERFRWAMLNEELNVRLF